MEQLKIVLEHLSTDKQRNNMLLLENYQLEYDIIKPINNLWWQSNNQPILEPLYSVKLFKGKLKEVIKYNSNGNNSIGDSF